METFAHQARRGHWAQYTDPHRACWHVKCVLRGARGFSALLSNCLTDVCLYDDDHHYHHHHHDDDNDDGDNLQ